MSIDGSDPLLAHHPDWEVADVPQTSAATPDVSVVIPTRNRRALLRRALRSVLAQRRVAIEVFVVDDASTDGTADFVRSLGDPRVMVVRHQTARGVAAARNTGLARARAPWVAFLDDDDMWAPTKLTRQLSAAAQAGAGWVCAGAVIVDETLAIVAGKGPPVNGDVSQLLAFNIVPGGGSGPVVRTDLARAVGGFDSAFSILADWDMWIRLFLETPPACVWHPVVAYLRHTGSMSHLNEGFDGELDRMVVKHARARQQLGVEMGRDRWLRWAAAMQIRAGNRRQAVQTYVHLASRYRDLKSVGRALVGGLFPALIVRYWSQSARRQLPAGWWEEAEVWLAPLRNGHAAVAPAWPPADRRAPATEHPLP
jgi:glycosyltransferase involved in cell wall biosynthesis